MDNNRQDSTEKLFMSVRIPDRNDFIQGFGSRELAVTFAGAGAALVLLVTIYSATGGLTGAIAAAAFLVAAVILSVRRDICNESFVDKIRQVYRYHKNQKKYEYRRHHFNQGECGNDGFSTDTE